MMLTCQSYTGEDAAAMGLANYCVADEALDTKVTELAALILGNSRHSNAENKRLIYDTDGMGIAAGLNHELMRNAGFDPAMRKKGEPIGAEEQSRGGDERGERDGNRQGDNGRQQEGYRQRDDRRPRADDVGGGLGA